MKKREITNKELEQMFDNIIGRYPILTDEQINTLLSNTPKSGAGKTTKRFLRYHLHTFIPVTTVVFILVAVVIWINSNKTVVSNNPAKNQANMAFIDTTESDSAEIYKNEITSIKTNGEESVSKTNSEISQNDSINSISDIYNLFEIKPQVFLIRADRDTVIVCKEGTLVKIKANTFISDQNGEISSGIIRVKVKEYFKISEMVFSNLRTTSEDKILETGGMLHISASNGSENYVIKPGSQIEIGFPYSVKKNDMALFYGEKSGNNIDWKPANTTDDVFVMDAPIIEGNEAGAISQTFFIVEDMPEFPGGEGGLQSYLRQNTVYPFSALKDSIEGKVLLTFLLDTNGNTRNIRVTQGLDKTLNKAAVYIISKMPKWKPGRQRGKPVNVSYTIPVVFSLKKGGLTPEEIRQSKELDEKLKDFEFDVEAINFYANSSDFKEVEENIKNGNFNKTSAFEVNRYLFSVTQLGWINCDRFIKNSRVIDFFIPTDDSEEIIVNAIFHRFKSLIPGRIQSGRIIFKNVPEGEKVNIVAIKTINHKIFLSVSETKITKSGELVLDFQPITLELLKTELEKLDKLYK